MLEFLSLLLNNLLLSLPCFLGFTYLYYFNLPWSIKFGFNNYRFTLLVNIVEPQKTINCGLFQAYILVVRNEIIGFLVLVTTQMVFTQMNPHYCTCGMTHYPLYSSITSRFYIYNCFFTCHKMHAYYVNKFHLWQFLCRIST